MAKPISSVATAHWILRFLFDKRRGFVAGEVSKQISNGVLLWIGARRQLLSAAGWIAPSFFDCAPIHAASTERFSSGEAKAIWLSPVPANLPP